MEHDGAAEEPMNQRTLSRSETVRHVRRIAVTSRLIVLVLQILANNLVPDHNADVFNPPVTTADSNSYRIVSCLLGGFRRWDAIYFLFIAEHGYIYENCLAFFPLYPVCVRFGGIVLNTMSFGLLDFPSSLLFTGVLLNMVLFVKTAESLYGWMNVVANGQFRNLAFTAVVAFCFNPAGIFFSACYSECMFACLTFTGLKYLEESKRGYGRSVSKWISLPLLSLSGAVRSNGVVNLGYLGFLELKSIWNGPWRVRTMIGTIARGSFLLLVGITPFVLFQIYAYFSYCRNSGYELSPELIQYAKDRGYSYLHSEKHPSKWCSQRIPLAYSFIQSSHWNVGLFQYYEWKQLPNFALAFPVLTLSVYGVCFLWRKGLVGALLPYVVHLLFLVIVNLVFAHVQWKYFEAGFIRQTFAAGFKCCRKLGCKISTRMIFSGSPLIYLVVACLFGSLRPGTFASVREVIAFEKCSVTQKAVILYFGYYFLMGICLHCNFLPWT